MSRRDKLYARHDALGLEFTARLRQELAALDSGEPVTVEIERDHQDPEINRCQKPRRGLYFPLAAAEIAGWRRSTIPTDPPRVRFENQVASEARPVLARLWPKELLIFYSLPEEIKRGDGELLARNALDICVELNDEDLSTKDRSFRSFLLAPSPRMPDKPEQRGKIDILVRKSWYRGWASETWSREAKVLRTVDSPWIMGQPLP